LRKRANDWSRASAAASRAVFACDSARNAASIASARVVRLFLYYQIGDRGVIRGIFPFVFFGLAAAGESVVQFKGHRTSAYREKPA
jgi:hypothetical protein